MFVINQYIRDTNVPAFYPNHEKLGIFSLCYIDKMVFRVMYCIINHFSVQLNIAYQLFVQLKKRNRRRSYALPM
jgi:hypothetical protein